MQRIPTNLFHTFQRFYHIDSRYAFPERQIDGKRSEEREQRGIDVGNGLQIIEKAHDLHLVDAQHQISDGIAERKPERSADQRQQHDFIEERSGDLSPREAQNFQRGDVPRPFVYVQERKVV